MLLRKSLRIAGSLFLLLSVGQAAFTQGAYRRSSSWEYIGQARVDGMRDHDRIFVGRGEGRFQNIRIRVAGAPIMFERVVVHYANGGSEEVAIRSRIPAGGQSRAIDLRGRDRAINSVEVWYGRGSRWTYYQPRVYLYGR